MPTNYFSKTAYFFVTHSLGSRMVYDDLLELSRNRAVPNVPTLTDPETTDAPAYVGGMIGNTPAIVM